MKIDENLINWNELPSWANFMATDNKGRTWLFSNKPIVLENGTLENSGGICGQIETIPIKLELLHGQVFENQNKL